MSPIIAAVGIASGLYHAMLTGAAVVGILTACPADPEICSKARSMATHSSIAVVGCVALSSIAIRRGRIV
jgi:Ca2+/Na+ antiporter